MTRLSSRRDCAAQAAIVMIQRQRGLTGERVPEEDEHGKLRPLGNAETYRQHASLLRVEAGKAQSPELRAEFERLALLYERLAATAAGKKNA